MSIEKIQARFTSGNSVPVDKAVVLASEWSAAMSEIATLRAALWQPKVEQQARPVTPYTCPKCHALWLHWPAEQTGSDKDCLNCRSQKWCDYCEQGGIESLQRLERVPAILTAPKPAQPDATTSDTEVLLRKILTELGEIKLSVNSRRQSDRAICLISAIRKHLREE